MWHSEKVLVSKDEDFKLPGQAVPLFLENQQTCS